jgi:hypothetical protein
MKSCKRQMSLTPELKLQMESMKQMFIREASLLSKKTRNPHEEMMFHYYLRKLVEINEMIKTGIIRPFKTQLQRTHVKDDLYLTHL